MHLMHGRDTDAPAPRTLVSGAFSDAAQGASLASIRSAGVLDAIY